MPKVRPYESQVNPGGEIPTAGASLSEVGGPGSVNLGQSIVNAGYSGAHAYQIIQANEDAAAVSDAHVKLAQIQASETQRFANYSANADPANPDHWDTFRRGGATPDEEVPRVDSLQYKLDALSTATQNSAAKRVVATGAAQLSQHFLDKTVQLSAHLAGVQAKQQAQTFTDAQQTRVQTDPSELKGALADTHNYFQTAFPKMDAAWKDAMTQTANRQIGGSMVRGMLTNPNNGSLVLSRLDAGHFDAILTGEDKVALTSAAQRSVMAMETEQRRAEADARRVETAAQDATAGKYTSQFIQHRLNPTNPLMSHDKLLAGIARDSMPDANGKVKLRDQDARAIMSMIHADANTPVLHNNEQVSGQLLAGIYADYGAPNKVTSIMPIVKAATPQMDPKTGKVIAPAQITIDRMNQLMTHFENAKTDTGLKLGQDRERWLAANKSSITSSIVGVKLDQQGDVNFGNLKEFAAQEEERLRAANKNPHDLYNSESPEYLGKRLQPFTRTIKQQINEAAGKIRGAPGLPKTPQGAVPDNLKRLPGETPEQYDKRTGK